MGFKEIISDLTEEDEDELYGLIHQEFWHFLQISGLYINPSKPVLLIFPFIHVNIHILHLTMFVITTIYVYPDVFVMCDCINYFFLALTTLVLLVVFNANRKYIAFSQKAVLKGLYEYGPTFDVDKKRFLEPWIKEFRFFKRVYPIAVGIGSFLILTSEAILDYFTGHEKHVYEDLNINTHSLIITRFPFRTDEGIPLAIVNALQLAHGTSVVLIAVPAIIFYHQLTTNVSVELTFLMMSIRKMRERTSSLYLTKYGKKHSRITDIDYEDCLYSCFNQNIQHFHKIVQLFNATQTICSVALFLFFFVSAFLFSTAGIGLVNDNTRIGVQVKASFLCLIEIGLLALLCWKGEQVRSLFEDTRDVLYGFDWYNTSNKFNNSMLIMQMSTLKPYSLSGAGMVTADYSTFSTIMNTSFSYLNLLLASKGL